MNSLEGSVVATTRAEGADGGLADALRREGARVVCWPTIAFDPASDRDALSAAVARCRPGDWIAFTSPRAVGAVIDVSPSPPASVYVAAVGPTTAEALRNAEWPVTVIGSGGAAELVEAWGGVHTLDGARILFPAGSLARPALEEALTRCGACVERIEAYRTRAVPLRTEAVRGDLARGVDVVTFTSPSAVRALRDGLGPAWPAALRECAIAVIGDTTRSALEESGIEPTFVVTASEPGVPGLVRAAAEAAGSAAAGRSGTAA